MSVGFGDRNFDFFSDEVVVVFNEDGVMEFELMVGSVFNLNCIFLECS